MKSSEVAKKQQQDKPNILSLENRQPGKEGSEDTITHPKKWSKDEYVNFDLRKMRQKIQDIITSGIPPVTKNQRSDTIGFKVRPQQKDICLSAMNIALAGKFKNLSDFYRMALGLGTYIFIWYMEDETNKDLSQLKKMHEGLAFIGKLMREEDLKAEVNAMLMNIRNSNRPDKNKLAKSIEEVEKGISKIMTHDILE